MLSAAPGEKTVMAAEATEASATMSDRAILKRVHLFCTTHIKTFPAVTDYAQTRQRSVSNLRINLPGQGAAFVPFSEMLFDFTKYELGPNDSPIQRGDREDTGDNEAGPDETGSGYAQPTVDPTAFGGETSISHSTTDDFDPHSELGDVEGLQIRPADDRSLGLTDVPDEVPADDWAADTGPTRTPGEKR